MRRLTRITLTPAGRLAPSSRPAAQEPPRPPAHADGPPLVRS